MKTHNRPVIFMDFGGVYFTSGTKIAMKKISKELGIPEKTFALAVRGRHRNDYLRGKTTAKDFWKQANKHLCLGQKQLKIVEHMWHSSFTPQKDMPQLVRRLNKKYRVAVLSGNMKERVKFLNKRYGILRYFHHHHFTYECGFIKPDARLFRWAIRKMNLKPEDCIVIDDSKNFLAAVKKEGAKTILFRNAKHLERELKKLGVEA